MQKKWIATGAAVVVAGAATVGLVAAAGDDDEQPITGAELERASKAALEHTGGGTVTDTEKGDEEGLYEVEVTRDDGTQVDVHLDAEFNVTSTEEDGAGEDDED